MKKKNNENQDICHLKKFTFRLKKVHTQKIQNFEYFKPKVYGYL